MLRLIGVQKRYGSLVAVDGVSLEIQRGEVFGLLGPNGAGKTTTVHMVAGLWPPDGGRVELDGAGSPMAPRVRRRIGVAPQALALYEELSGRENVAFFGRIQGLRGEALARRVEEALAFVGLTDRAGDRVRRYSGGMKRRLNLAAALVHQPDLLLLDEPTVGVDPHSRHAIFENILALRAQGRTIVYTTHYMEEAQRLCDRVGIMDRGKLLAVGSLPELIRAHGGHSRVVATTTAGPVEIATDDPLAELRRMESAGGLVSFHVDRPSLETVFLNLTGRSLRDE
jgi:ABC-2 type transport system ATP-binding protein